MLFSVSAFLFVSGLTFKSLFCINTPGFVAPRGKTLRWGGACWFWLGDRKERENSNAFFYFDSCWTPQSTKILLFFFGGYTDLFAPHTLGRLIFKAGHLCLWCTPTKRREHCGAVADLWNGTLTHKLQQRDSITTLCTYITKCLHRHINCSFCCFAFFDPFVWTSQTFAFYFEFFYFNLSSHKNKSTFWQ